MMARELIGTGTVDSNGIAVLDTDPEETEIDGYVGVGAGRLRFVAVVDGFESELFEVMDCLEYDLGVLSDYNNSIWSYNSNNINFIRESEYTAISLNLNISNGNAFVRYLDSDVVVDFEYYQVDGSANGGFLGVVSGSDSLTVFSLANMGLTGSAQLKKWHKLRLKIGKYQATLISLDDESKRVTQSYELTGTPDRIRFRFVSTNIRNIRVRDLMAYNLDYSEQEVATVGLASDKIVVSDYHSDTCTLTATVLDEDGWGVEGRTVSFYQGNTLLGTDVTGDDGVAEYEYEATGVGEISFSATCDEVNSNDITVIDAIIDATGKTDVWYSTTVALENDRLKWVVPSSSKYWSLRGSQILDSIGKTINVHLVTESERNRRLNVFVASQSGWSDPIATVMIPSGLQTTDLEAEIPSTATNVWIRLQSNTADDQLDEGDVVYCDEWYVYSNDVVPPTPTPTVDSIELSSDKSILSFVDGDSCTLTAVALDENDDPVEGATVEFFNGSTSMGTEQTDSSGIATKTYSSTGAGDISFKASVGMIVSEIYEVCDALIYVQEEISPTASYSSYLSRTLSDFSFDGSIDYEVEMDFKLSAGGGGFSIAPINDATYKKHIAFGYNSNQITTYWGKNDASGENSQRHNQSLTWNTFHHWKITKIGSEFNWDRNNGEDTFSTTASWLGTYGAMGLYFYKWESPSMVVKNIKIKQL